MMICKCGGRVDKDFLTNGNERLVCKDCGRYEIFFKDLLTNPQNAYNADMDNRKAHDSSSLLIGAM
jgi:hypothetical protein